MKKKKAKKQKSKLEKYISLSQAAEMSPYSQEYLSLRARQGKLKSTKLGRNWVTTKKWVSEYMKKIGDESRIGLSDTKKAKKQISQKAVNVKVNFRKLSDTATATTVKIVAQKEAPPPENLPSGEFFYPSALKKEKKDIKLEPSEVRVGFVFALVCFLIIFGAVWQKKDTILVAYDKADKAAESSVFITEYSVDGLKGDITFASFFGANIEGITKDTVAVFSDFWRWFINQSIKIWEPLKKNFGGEFKKTSFDYISSIGEGFKQMRDFFIIFSLKTK